MDSPDNNIPSGKSPRSLQGPRPTPLRVHKDSHKIRKPPVHPPHPLPHPHPHPHPHPQSHRPPVIIYTVSPKIIHTNPNEFMTLVQRLTGPSAPSPIGSSSSAFHEDTAISPAARFASIEKAVKSPDGRKPLPTGELTTVETGYFPGILSPGPAALPPIPANLFSPLGNDFFQDLSPALLHSNSNNNNNRSYNYFEGNSFVASPTNLLSSHIISPTTSPNVDLFHSLFDL